MSRLIDARSEAAAIRQYVEPVQQAIAAFAENVQLGYVQAHAQTRLWALTILSDDVVCLQDAHGDLRLGLGIELAFRTVPNPLQPRRWTVETCKYIYRLEEPTFPVRELVGYHWHPEVEGIAFPHIHMAVAEGEARKVHVATPHASLRHVLATAMRDFDVVAVVAHRHDWQSLLQQADEVLQSSMHWAI